MIPLSLGLKFAGVKFTAGLIFIKLPVNKGNVASEQYVVCLLSVPPSTKMIFKNLKRQGNKSS